MRQFGTIHAQFWTSETIFSLDVHEKLLALYLMTCTHSNFIGCYRLPLAYICADLNWDTEQSKQSISNLQHAGFIQYDAKSGWVFIIKYALWNPAQNESQAKHRVSLFEKIPTSLPFYLRITESILASAETAKCYPKAFLAHLRELQKDDTVAQVSHGEGTVTARCNHSEGTVTSQCGHRGDTVATRCGHGVSAIEKTEKSPITPDQNGIQNHLSTTYPQPKNEAKNPQNNEADFDEFIEQNQQDAKNEFDENFYSRHGGDTVAAPWGSPCLHRGDTVAAPPRDIDININTYSEIKKDQYIKKEREKEKYKKEKEKEKKIEEQFALLKAIYPGTIARKKVCLWLAKRNPSDELFAAIIQGIENQLAERKLRTECGLDEPFWKHLTTWLNGDHWEDTVHLEPEYWQRVAHSNFASRRSPPINPSHSRVTEQNLAAVQQFINYEELNDETK